MDNCRHRQLHQSVLELSVKLESINSNTILLSLHSFAGNISYYEVYNRTQSKLDMLHDTVHMSYHDMAVSYS